MITEKKPGNEDFGVDIVHFRRCGCVKTSEKLKKVLESFPPPTPARFSFGQALSNINLVPSNNQTSLNDQSVKCVMYKDEKTSNNWTFWQVLGEIVQLVQLSVTATALAFYYIIYCYMQLVYYTLRTAIYFHNADVPMKITIGVVTATSLLVGFNILLRIEKLLFY